MRAHRRRVDTSAYVGKSTLAARMSLDPELGVVDSTTEVVVVSVGVASISTSYGRRP